VVRLLLVVIAASVLSMQVFKRTGKSAQPSPAARDSRLLPLKFGALALPPCEVGRRGVAGVGTVSAYCTDFDVPEDWNSPAGHHIKLRIAIVKSSAEHSQSDLVTFLDGGPGGAATEDFPAIAGQFAALRERRDILLIDQRGTGGSNALSCPTDIDKSKDLADSPQLLQHCLDAVRAHAAPEHYTTTQSTRDLEAVRQALGAPSLDLIGVSYGTRVAQQYAGHYPSAVRSVVLDSPVPNTLVLGSEQARNLEQSLRAWFAVCSADTLCRHNFGDSYLTLYRLRDRLRAHPQDVSLHDPNSFEIGPVQMSAEDLVSIVRFYAYNPLTAALLPLMLHEADHGNFAPLLAQKKLLTDTLGAELNSAMSLSVVCSEDADLLTPQPQDADTLMGTIELAKIRSACAVWPKGARPSDFHDPWISSLPVLVLAGQYDPVTPPAYGTQIVQHLPQGRLLLAAGQGHSVMGAGCMPKLVSQFIDTLSPFKLDTRCLEALGNAPAFVNFNGAPP
jgi:pimeloyl-ACP methyl ester carboxylesterase